MSSNQKPIESDIPGFYYDKERKRYYRIRGIDSSNPLYPEKIRRIEGHRESEKTKNELRQSNTISVPKAVGLFQSAGPSNRSAQSFRKNFLASAMAQLSNKFTHVVLSGDNECKPRDILMSVNVNGKVGSSFSMASGGTVVVTSTVDFPKQSVRDEISNEFPVHKVVDMKACTFDGGDFIGQACQALGRDTHFISIRPASHEVRLDDYSQQYEFPANQTIWSLAITSTHLAVGMERKIQTFGMTDETFEDLPVPNENVFVLENDGDHQLYAGTNKGQVHLIDLRSHKIESSVKFGAPLSNLKVSKNHMAASGYDHKLTLYDIRNTATSLATFKEHQNASTPHISLQIHDKLDLIASTGSDNVIRFWSLKDFQLISTLSDASYVSVDSPPAFVIEDSWGPVCAVAVASESTISFYA